MIIGIAGKKRSGKTTLAKYLEDKHRFYHFNLADPLKDMIHALGVSRLYTHGDRKEEAHPLLNGRTARYAMQTLGTEWGRKCMGEDFWIKLWKEEVRDMPKVVVDDLRFDNEAKAVKELGGKLILLHRDQTGQLDSHASEQGISLSLDARVTFDLVIYNNSDITDMLLKLENFVASSA